MAEQTPALVASDGKTEPEFKTYAELQAWCERVGKRVQWNIQMAPDRDAKQAAMEKGLDKIKRAILVHAHLLPRTPLVPTQPEWRE